jgi:hypothetical protein
MALNGSSEDEAGFLSCARALSTLSESWVRENRTPSLMGGIWKRRHGQIVRHRQPKGSETVKDEPTSTAPDLELYPEPGFSGDSAL